MKCRSDYTFCELRKVSADEPIFVIRAQDAIGPEVVEQWAVTLMMRHGGATYEKAQRARAVAQDMRRWQKEHGSKVPD